MFDSLKGKTNKKFDDMFRKNGVPDTIKIDECSIFSDPKIAELMLAEHQWRRRKIFHQVYFIPFLLLFLNIFFLDSRPGAKI